jgi:hypothetical protein
MGIDNLIIMKRNQYKNEYTEEQRQKYKDYSKAYREKRANEYPGYAVYYIPEEHYVGMSNDIYSRMSKHKHLGKIIDGWEVLICFENPIRAHLMETQLHLMGYNGYRP